MNLSETVESVPLPGSMSFITDDDLLKDIKTPHVTAFVAYLVVPTGPEGEGWIYYHPVVFAPGNMAERSEDGIRKKVQNAIAVFQAAIRSRKARVAKPGDCLEWRTQ